MNFRTSHQARAPRELADVATQRAVSTVGTLFRPAR